MATVTTLPTPSIYFCDGSGRPVLNPGAGQLAQHSLKLCGGTLPVPGGNVPAWPGIIGSIPALLIVVLVVVGVVTALIRRRRRRSEYV